MIENSIAEDFKRRYTTNICNLNMSAGVANYTLHCFEFSVARRSTVLESPP